MQIRLISFHQKMVFGIHVLKISIYASTFIEVPLKQKKWSIGVNISMPLNMCLVIPVIH